MNPKPFLPCLLAALLALSLAPTALAQGMRLVSADNDSSPDTTDFRPLSTTHFESVLRVAPPVMDERSVSIELSLRWQVIHDYQAGAVIDLAPDPTLAWAMTLHVDDPLAQGFKLEVGSHLRGSLGTWSREIGMLHANTLPDFSFGFYEMFATQPTPLPDVRLEGSALDVGGVTLLDRRITLNQGGTAKLGHYRGSQSFLFFLRPVSLDVGVSSLYGSSYAWQQFGRTTTDPAWAFANPLPGIDPADLGQFFRVTATFPTAPVPEPATWLSLAAGLALLGARRLQGDRS
jgi:hypothetical protein